ncbi:hypothetical protein BJI69_08185 [Luteibacter rhizovicinus DSM 16549]|uniref:Uncharacterized protein n=1 Tax=Luteibacter rhizovicinus DSM 16549 TaxID=1440763 RepID=A0A1L3ES37_9GAMM|nr:hypothetical protein [Luteibacter rhizovicinus]APG03885.1 hypothetical protein BJI69_08185 [Luteibacter rhizovicinus DSM 16549]
MLDTLEMLEAIGSDASLRYAPTVDLASALENAKAIEALTEAVVSGDITRLRQDFGGSQMHAPQISQSFFDRP